MDFAQNPMFFQGELLEILLEEKEDFMESKIFNRELQKCCIFAIVQYYVPYLRKVSLVKVM